MSFWKKRKSKQNDITKEAAEQFKQIVESDPRLDWRHIAALLKCMNFSMINKQVTALELTNSFNCELADAEKILRDLTDAGYIEAHYTFSQKKFYELANDEERRKQREKE